MWIGQVFLFYIPLLDPLWGSACLARLYLFFITSNWGSNQLWDNPPYYPLSCDPYVQATKVDIDKERKQKRQTKKKIHRRFSEGQGRVKKRTGWSNANSYRQSRLRRWQRSFSSNINPWQSLTFLYLRQCWFTSDQQGNDPPIDWLVEQAHNVQD